MEGNYLCSWLSRHGCVRLGGMASLLPVVFVLAALLGLGFVSWFVVPKGPQQTYVMVLNVRH